MYTNADCTIFHKTLDSNGDDEYTTFYIPKVFWEGIEGDRSTGEGLENADKAFIVIPDSGLFIKPKEYERLVDKGDYWTIKTDDKIVKGVVDGLVDFGDLESEYDDVIRATAVDDKRFGSEDMHHLEIKGV